VILVDCVEKSYGDVRALKSVSFEVRAGEVFGLLGANGAGKTTLNRCIATLIRPDSGRIEVAGCDVEKDPDGVRAALGYLAEFPQLYPALSAEEFLRFAGGLRGVSGDELSSRIDRWLELFELQEARGRPLKGFSQGMLRKTALAATLLGEPRVVLLDEPTNGLDPPSVYLFRRVLEGLRDEGRTVLLSSHVLPFVAKVCDRIGILAGGGLRAVGTQAELRIEANLPDADLEELFLHFSGLDVDLLDRLAVAGLR
jgi:ABC-2 type transport system ATP-binding protein